MGETAGFDVVGGVSAGFERSPRIDLHHYPIEVSMRDGAVVLDGTVADIGAKKTAVAIAREMAGGASVVDHLRVATSEHREDGALRDAVVHALMQEPVFSEYGLSESADGEGRILREPVNGEQGRIEIRVHDGIVTLSGQVGSLTHRRLAEVLAWWMDGCEDVDNRLRVVPGEVETDGELSDAVRMALEKDPFVHAGQLSIAVRGRVVTLRGSVASEQERRLAELDAWYIPGVQQVIDEIEARG